jgi:hypothetical protein
VSSNCWQPPTLKHGDIVVTDRHKAHFAAGVREAIEAAGATLLYLSQYSPDLDPIELAFAKFKALLGHARLYGRWCILRGVAFTRTCPWAATRFSAAIPQRPAFTSSTAFAVSSSMMRRI